MKRRNILVLMISLSLVLLLGSSYAILRSTIVGNNSYVINVGTLEVTFVDSETEFLNLSNMYPMTDDEGKSLTNELVFQVKNTGNIDSYYDVTLEETSTNPEFKSVIKYIVNKDDKGYNEPKTLEEDKFIEVGGYLKPNETADYRVKVWLAEEADNTYMNKEFKAKVVVNSFQESNYAKDVIKSKLVKYEESSKEDFPGGLVAVNTDGDLYNETDTSESIREYRYSGPNVNNYVTFNDETWRIIGVFKEGKEEFLKIVRNNVLESSKIPENYTINDSLYNFRKNNTTWVIFNSDYLDANWRISPVSHYLNNYNDDATTSNYGYLHYLNEKTINMIRETSFYLGNATFRYSNPQMYGIIDSPKKSYTNERDVEKCIDNTAIVDNQTGCYIFSTSPAIWNDKIGLMYASDYGYSVNNIYWNTSMLLGTFDGEIAQTSWLQKIRTTNEWLITRPVSTKAEAGVFYIDGYLGNGAVKDGAALRPTLYLKSNVKITSGDGSQDNAYILSF